MLGTKKLAGHLVTRAGGKAYNASIAASRAAKVGVGSADKIAQDAMNAAMVARGKTAQSSARKMIYGGGAVGAASITTAMRPNANQHRGGYKGPRISTPTGSGRFA